MFKKQHTLTFIANVACANRGRRLNRLVKFMSHATSIYVGRQQIFDRDLNTAAYELLFRSGSENRAQIVDGDAATSQLLINSVVEIGLENLTFGRPAFVNFTRNFFVGERKLPFDPNQLVVEVLETVEPDPEVIAALISLRNAGYTIALDDFVDSDNREQLLNLSDIVKVDLMGYDRNRLAAEVKRLKKLPLRLLAEKVETADEFKQCKDLGFDFFQGYFLARPEVVAGKTIPNNQLALLQLLAKIRDPAVTFDEVVDLVKQDVALSVKLLRYVNSLAHGVRKQIDSVRQAAVRLGLERICQIVTLIAMSGINDERTALLETALIRAKMCEIIADSVSPENREVAFTVGLFSSLDAFLNQSLTELLKELPVTADVREALLLRTGSLGRVLNCVTAFECGDWPAAQIPDVDDSIIQQAYLNSVKWAHAESTNVCPELNKGKTAGILRNN